MAGYNILTLFILCAVIVTCDSDSNVSCKNDTGHDVDWYILYKLPKGYPNGDSDGRSYLYLDESSRRLRLSEKMIDSVSGALGNTLKPMLDFYDKKTEGFGYMLYNDQPPNSYNPSPSSFGHSKGAVLLNRMSGVWLSHSTPRFPTYRKKMFWPQTANQNGQIFMCVTYPYEQFKQIGTQLKYIHAYSFDYDLPTTFHEILRCVAQRDRGCYPKKEPWFSLMTLTSASGRNFSSFAKYTRFGDDLYSGLIVNSVKQNLYVKSWGKMRSPLDSNCSDIISHHVYNVSTLQLLPKMSFPNTVDHSKWCVTEDKKLTCIADMNREKSQMGRGGGAICIDDSVVGKAFYELISMYDKCP